MIERVIREAINDLTLQGDSLPPDFSGYLMQRGIEPNEFEQYMRTDHGNVLDAKVKERYLQMKARSEYYRR